jgi:hypothetical protein
MVTGRDVPYWNLLSKTKSFELQNQDTKKVRNKIKRITHGSLAIDQWLGEASGVLLEQLEQILT